MSVKRRWAIPYWPGGCSADWLETRLAEHGVVCEFPECRLEAVTVYKGHAHVVWLCLDHSQAVEESDAIAIKLEKYMWELFDAAYNFIRRVHDTHGQYLQDTYDVKAALRKREAENRQEARAFVAELNAGIRGGQAGLPEDSLVIARGAQSPSPSPTQAILRRPRPFFIGLLIQPMPADKQGEQ